MTAAVTRFAGFSRDANYRSESEKAGGNDSLLHTKAQFRIGTPIMLPKCAGQSLQFSENKP